MGCSSSNPSNIDEIEQLKKYIAQLENKAQEKQNLLHFKMDVLVNMLSVEEKRNEDVTKRLETLKWLVHEQGISEEMLTNILNNMDENGKENISNIIGSNLKLKNFKLLDFTAAMNRMRQEFEKFKEDIIHSFALENGKIIATMPFNDFMKQIFTITESISKSDLQVKFIDFDFISLC